jgi:molybdenum cofactor cytidylyltransferase
MGSRNKLLLPWGDSTIIERVLQAWIDSRVERVVLVTRSDDQPLHERLPRVAKLEWVIPEKNPDDMKQSVLLGLRHLTAYSPSDHDRWLIAPADMPDLQAELINRVIDANGSPSTIVVPTFAGRRGHPISLPWAASHEVGQLGPDEGINRLLDRWSVEPMAVDPAYYPADIDTEEDYRRARKIKDR